MKKIVSFVVMICGCFCACAMLIACGHTHAYKTESISDTQHKKNCSCGEEIIEEHSWDEGEIIVAPTITSKGEIRYKCMGCEYTCTSKIDEIVTTVTDTEWVNALDLRDNPHVLNETLVDGNETSTGTIKYSIDKIYQAQTFGRAELQGIIKAEVFYYIEGNKCYYVLGQIQPDASMLYQTSEITVEQYESLKNSALNYSLMFPRANFVYDEENYEYRFIGELTIDGYEVEDATIRFENGKVVRVEITRKTRQDKTLSNTMLFSYGVPQINIPQA